MPSTFRIPRAPMTGPYGRLVEAVRPAHLGPGARHRLRRLAPPQRHERRARLRAQGRPVGRARPAPGLASPRSPAPPSIGCSWCLDFGYFMAHDEGLDEAKVREVPRWRESDVFTPVERDVLEYAEAMSATPADRRRRAQPPAPGGARGQGGRRAHPARRAGEHALAVQQRRRAEAQGYSDVCELPLAVRSAS